MTLTRLAQGAFEELADAALGKVLGIADLLQGKPLVGVEGRDEAFVLPEPVYGVYEVGAQLFETGLRPRVRGDGVHQERPTLPDGPVLGVQASLRRGDLGASTDSKSRGTPRPHAYLFDDFAPRRKAQQVLGELRPDAFDLLGARAHATGHPVLAAQPVQDGPAYLGYGEGLELGPLATLRAVGLYGVEQAEDGPDSAGDVLDHRGVMDDEPIPKLVDLPLGLAPPLAGVCAGGDLLAKLEVARS